MAIEPVTREERFLAAAGGQSVTTPTPITRKEQLLQGIIDAVKSGGVTPDVIEGAVNDYLNANPVQPGATTEQAAQIEQNKTDIADLQTEVDELKESGGNGSGQNVDLTGYAKETWVRENYQPKGNYALASDVPTKVSQLANDKGYLTEHQDISGKLDASALPTAINTALAQAKASGEFDGKDGYLCVTKAEYAAMTAEQLAQHYTDGVRLVIVEDEYENLVPTAISQNGGVYYGCGYQNGIRLTSSGTIEKTRQACVTGFISNVPGAQLEVYGSKGPLGTFGNYVAAYDTDFALIGATYMESMPGITAVADERNLYTYTCNLIGSKFNDAAYIRISLNPCEGRDVIVKIGGATA